MIDSHSSYKPGDSMRDLMRDNNLLLMTISRFGIGFGFGDDSVRNVCRINGVDCSTFLAVTNLLSSKEHEQYDANLSALMEYLKATHRYYLEISLPKLRRKILEAISAGGDKDIALMLIKFYDDYVLEIKAHLEEENNCIFPYVTGLLDGKSNPGFSLSSFMSDHSPVTQKLQELKDIFIYHYTNRNAVLMGEVLFDIVNLEKDLLSHFEIENHLLLPAAKRLEESLRSTEDEVKEQQVSDSPLDTLGEREKEIIRLIACGYSNKEIASELFISVHTVATHRKNIISKLQIHSTSGLTIFAILHGLIDIKDISK